MFDVAICEFRAIKVILSFRFKDKQRLDKTDTNLLIAEVQEQDSGTYYCSAISGAGTTLSQSATLVVKGQWIRVQS